MMDPLVQRTSGLSQRIPPAADDGLETISGSPSVKPSFLDDTHTNVIILYTVRMRAS